jgi:hypothetical protein
LTSSLVTVMLRSSAAAQNISSPSWLRANTAIASSAPFSTYAGGWRWVGSADYIRRKEYKCAQLAKHYDRTPAAVGYGRTQPTQTQHDTPTALYITHASTAKHRISHGDNTAHIRIQRGIHHSTHTSMEWCASDEHRNPNVSATRSTQYTYKYGVVRF